MRVLYYVSDTNVPSWGVGMIYTHVRLLCANGIEAAVLHTQPGFRPKWMSFDAPRLYLRDGSLRIAPDDLLVVPEVHAAEADVLSLAQRRIVFVQASSPSTSIASTPGSSCPGPDSSLLTISIK